MMKYLHVLLFVVCSITNYKNIHGQNASVGGLNIRLTNGQEYGEGLVQVRYNVTVPWGTICSDYWDDVDATVVCRMLGYKWGSVKKTKPGSGPIYMDNVQCRGNETILTNCAYNGWGKHNCFHSQDVGVRCFNNSVELKYRQPGTVGGVVHMRKLEGWVPVCDEDWDDIDATILCRELGFYIGKASCCSKLNSHVTPSRIFQSYTKFKCSGNESKLSSCPFEEVNDVKCVANGHRASAICSTSKTILNSPFKVRLVSPGGHSEWGEIQIRHQGLWGLSCARNFNAQSATVVCKELGYKGGIRVGSSEVPLKHLPSWISSINCTGTEASLKDCVNGTWGEAIDSCYTNKVVCYNKGNFSLTLSNGGSQYGTVELKLNGETGVICSTGWSDINAGVVCRSLGYYSGSVYKAIDIKEHKHNIFLDGVDCKGDEKSIVACKNKGWKQFDSHCLNQTGRASVICYNKVRLDRGNGKNGIVLAQISQHSHWIPLCGNGFGDTEASVVCKELGYNNGSSLGQGSFGPIHSHFGFMRNNISCSGAEPSILNCTYSRLTCPFSSNLGYAAVDCYNGSRKVENRLYLDRDSTTTSNETGRVLVYLRGIKGRICPVDFDDVDASVACKQLSRVFIGGISLQYIRKGSEPILMSNVRCRGNETSIFQCQYKSGMCQLARNTGVLCYKSHTPKFQLRGDSSSSGRVEIVYDNHIGSICIDVFHDSVDVSNVVCRQLGFTGGKMNSSFPSSKTPIFISHVDCLGHEQSIFKCRYFNWRAKETCTKQLAVSCFNEVRLAGGSTKKQLTYGQVEVMVGGIWKVVCGRTFGEKEANITCRQLGYKFSRVIPPIKTLQRSFFFRYRTVGRFKCNGTEESLLKCYHNKWIFTCSAGASVVCSMTNITNDVSVYIDPKDGSTVVAKKYGIEGRICSNGWGDQEAMVLCRQMGYATGVALGPLYTKYIEAFPHFLTEFRCGGKESSTLSCPHTGNVSGHCVSQGNSNARVLCSKSSNGPKVHLVGGRTEKQGIVEIEFNGWRGTICMLRSSTVVNVICRQLGYYGGRPSPSTRYGHSTKSPFLYNPRCSGNEASVWHCPNWGFNSTNPICSSHKYDVRVDCFGLVKISPGHSYGAVQIYNSMSKSYEKVCADGFGDKEATVFCKEIGRKYGKSVCCSAFGYVGGSIQSKAIQCSGTEIDVTYCRSENTMCKSKSYASVVCSDVSPKSGFSVKLMSRSPFRGIAQIQYMGIWGYVCPNNFDDKDASVICRMRGYKDGFAYNKTSSPYINQRYLKWISNINCNGTEKNIVECQNLEWGKISNCSKDAYAAVYCFNSSGLELRLTGNHSAIGEGVVEMAVDGVWGRICISYYYNLNRNAVVMCRHLGYKSGRYVSSSRASTGPVFINRISCLGTETNITQCAIVWGNSYYCRSMHIQCFSNVKLSGYYLAKEYGKVKMLVSGKWMAVCDKGFDRTAANVVCRQIGYKDGIHQCCSALGKTLTPINITVVHCNGTENRLQDCSLKYGPCQSKKYVSVYCSFNKMVSQNLTIKLESSTSSSSGTILGNRFGLYGPICKEGFSDADANVTCRRLGMTGGVAMVGKTNLVTPVVVWGYSCIGSEDDLARCKRVVSANHTCPERYKTGNVAGVRCYNSGGSGIRIIGYSDRIGTLRLRFGNIWGRVCSWKWSNKDALVACRQLGYTSGIGTVNQQLSTNGTIIMSGTSCYGTEESLYQCSSLWFPKRSNTTCLDAGVICHRKIRLIQGNYISHGSVEVYVNGAWGRVCDHKWNDINTMVVCKELGFENGRASCCSPYNNKDTVVMDNVRCNGHESHLADCNHTDPLAKSCSSHNIAVACFNRTAPKKYNWRLGGGNNYTGEILVDYLGTTGRICSDGWDDKDARVACRALGFRNGTAYNHVRFDYYYSSNGPYWISNMACTGSERNLTECHVLTPIGNVTSCKTMKYAGVLCTDNAGIYYRLASGPQENIGRVEVSVDNKWGSVCDYYFEDKEAAVFCRSLGFTDGETIKTTFPASPAVTYLAHFQCEGTESNLLACPNNGLKPAKNWYCKDHKRDVGVICYGKVRLASGLSAQNKYGPVQVHIDGKWQLVCDVGFTDTSAKRVCEDLGFHDGNALCCSALGVFDLKMTVPNVTMLCNGSESNALDCLERKRCTSNSYASVVCLRSTDFIDEQYIFTSSLGIHKSGIVDVHHYGVKGFICDSFWDDIDAKVFCKQIGYIDGLAYRSSDPFYSLLPRGPFWISDVNCTGTESSLSACSYNDRLNLGNCSGGAMAAAACFNYVTDIKYRLAGGNNDREGRVEISVGGVWGTVCDLFWDDRDAGVLCRQLGLSDGYAISVSKFGKGKGPMWLSQMLCDGTESKLHSCQHAGFKSTVVDTHRFLPCTDHKNDAAVYCVDKLKLSLGINASMGAVEIYANGTWKTVCDDEFKEDDARIVCKTFNYKYGSYIPGSKFGNAPGSIDVINVKCKGNEKDFLDCDYTIASNAPCRSGTYASVFCSNHKKANKGFKVRIEQDGDLNAAGLLVIQNDVINSTVCANGVDDVVASVACKELGFSNGAVYRSPKQTQLPIIFTGFKCSGNETSLESCRFSKNSSNWCDFYAPRLGVLCSKTNSDLETRLGGSDDLTKGRVELKYDGVWGSFCDFSMDSNIARVACKECGFKDGIRVSATKYGIATPKLIWMTRLQCFGNESSLLTCINNGFKQNQNEYQRNTCIDMGGIVAVNCFNSIIELTDVRLSGSGNGTGTVEVYLKGPNLWGTVCDDYWSDDDATVVCRQLGYATGKGVKRAQFGEGTGPIWLDNVGCKGTEMNIKDCPHNGFSIHNCDHSSDAGVICSGTFIQPASIPNKETSLHPYVYGFGIGVPIFVLVILAIGIILLIIWKKRRNIHSDIRASLVVDEPTARVTFTRITTICNRLKQGNPTTKLAAFDFQNPVYGESVKEHQ